MSIETLDDIVTELANSYGIYGAPCSCEEQENGCNKRACRMCWEVGMKLRIREAVSIENKLASYHQPNTPA